MVKVPFCTTILGIMFFFQPPVCKTTWRLGDWVENTKPVYVFLHLIFDLHARYLDCGDLGWAWVFARVVHCFEGFQLVIKSCEGLGLSAVLFLMFAYMVSTLCSETNPDNPG